ncbi:MAG: ribosomal RNA small subunit methyltransferase B [Ignavibacteriaceae bacterium]|nr:MAG: ribosomal RNA small subunit methyltransferase B [Ignavibacteriaceae bacterium]
MEIEEHRVKDLYTGVRGTAVKILDRIERTDSYLEKLLDHELKNSDLSGQDKALLYELVHGVVRWMGRLDWILAGFYKGQFSKAIPVLKNALRVALYQIMFLDKIPDYAIVNEAVDFVKKLQGQKPADITNAVLRNIIRSKNGLRYPDPAENLVSYLAAYYSHPTWLAKRWVARYGREAVETLMAANNERPTLTLRINGLKVDRQEFEGLLQSVNLRYTPGIYNDHFYRLQILTNIQNWQYFAEGYFAIQDESTGMPCLLLDVKPGMRVLDMCAAPGGKSAYIADLMSNTGEVVALDKFESRVKMMQANLDRLGVSIVKFVATDALEYEDELFDRVLVDAPCSGLGTLSKKPDIKWKRDLLDIKKLTPIQEDLLNKAAEMVKVGGAVVYSTCTIEPEENFEIVKKFLSEHDNFRLDDASAYVDKMIVDGNGCIQSLPHRDKMDGAFSARLVRTK